MPDPFSIDAPTTAVTVGEGQSEGRLEVDVGNLLDRHVHIGVEVRPVAPLHDSWVRLDPTSFDLGVNDNRRVAITVMPPADAGPGELSFSLRVYDRDHPADSFAESPALTVALQRRQPAPPGGLLAAVVGWFTGAVVGALAGGFLGFRLFTPAAGEPAETFGEALGAAIGEAIAAGIAMLVWALVVAWILSAAAVWLALRLRRHHRSAVTALLAAGLGIPWLVAVLLAGWLGDAVALLGWAAFLVLLVGNPALLARMLVLRVGAVR